MRICALDTDCICGPASQRACAGAHYVIQKSPASCLKVSALLHAIALTRPMVSFACCCAEAFARHVQHLLQYVTEDYLHADLDSAAASLDNSPASDQQGLWGTPARGILLKAQALKALARGLVTDRDKALVPVPSMRAVVDYVSVLER